MHCCIDYICAAACSIKCHLTKLLGHQVLAISITASVAMGMLLIVLMFSVCQFVCQAEEVVFEVESSNTSCNGTDNCELNNCIKKYSELHSHILSNKDLLDNLTEAFYQTGEEPSEFVKIIYQFHICNCSITNGTGGFDYDVDDVYDYDAMEEEVYNFNCNDSQELYIWSTSALYLLGPDPLFWLTMFAVNIPETSLIIQLPCLCKEPNYYDLLSRLTYLVSYVVELF